MVSLEWRLKKARSTALQVLQKICWYVVLAAASSDQVTLLQTTAADKKLDQLPAYKELLQTFITKEVRPLSCCPYASKDRKGSTAEGSRRRTEHPIVDPNLKPCFLDAQCDQGLKKDSSSGCRECVLAAHPLPQA